MPIVRKLPIVLAVLAAAVGLSTIGANAGDAANGERIAANWCAECHVIAPGAVRPSDDSPATFQEIADTPGWGVTALRVFFQTPHKQMPNFSVTDQVREDLIAYITGLKRQ